MKNYPMYIRDICTGKVLLPQHLISATLYATWDRNSAGYKTELQKHKEKHVDGFFDDETDEEMFIIMCNAKADLIFDSRFY